MSTALKFLKYVFAVAPCVMYMNKFFLKKNK